MPKISLIILKNGVSSRHKLYYQKKSGEIRKWGIKTIEISDEIYVAIAEDINPPIMSCVFFDFML